MEKIKRFGIMSVALFFMFGFSGIVSAKDFRCYLSPAETTLNVGEQVVVSVYFGTIPDAGLSGAGMTLYFNSEVLKVVDHFIGYPHWMTTNWYEEETYRPDHDDDNITDWVSMEGCTLMGFPTGEVLHATVTFEAIADGYGALSTGEIKPWWPNYCGSFVEEYGCIDDVTDFIGGSITVGAGPFYKNHLGMNATTGVDYFPYMERGWTGDPPVTIEYYSGVAALSMCAKFLYPAFDETAKTQDWLNEAYGGSGNTDELTCTEIRNGIQSELNLHPGMPYDPYNYTHAAVSEAQGGQDYAIRRFIHWTDYDAGNATQGYEPNAPSLVPTDGDLNWKVVRGFVTDIDPCPSTWVIPDIVLHGVWMNDPSIDWDDLYNPSQPPEYTSDPPMGANVFYTGDSFKAVYDSLSDGNWHAVNEPPRDLSKGDIALIEKNLKLAKIDYVAGKPNAELSNALMGVKIELKGSSAAMSKMAMTEAEVVLFDDVDWTEVIPDALWATPGFADVMYRSSFNEVMNVSNLETGEDYDLVTFSQSGKADTASVVVMVDETGAFLQGSWASEDEKYLSEKEALKIAKKALGCPQPIAITKGLKPLPICDTRDWETGLIWDKEYGQSKFQPIYEVSTSGATVYVLQNGNYFVEQDIPTKKPEPVVVLCK